MVVVVVMVAAVAEAKVVLVVVGVNGSRAVAAEWKGVRRSL